MNPKKRQKLCPSCEGEVDLDVIFCPFCGTDLLEEKNFSQNTTYYPPPYKPKLEEEIEEVKKQEEEANFSFFPFLAMNIGLWLLLLGVFLLLFSKDGVLWLRLNAKFWVYFLLGSLPLLGWGIKAFISSTSKET